MVLSIEMMIDEVLDPTPERLKSCYSELNRLSGLISDLERLESEETADIILEKEEVDPLHLSGAVMQGFATKMEEKKITGQVLGEKDAGIICVEDTGIGIAPEECDRVFERFYRTDKSRTRKTGGAGIGLSISKAIVKAHKGTITCESEIGKGSRFIVTLPRG